MGTASDQGAVITRGSTLAVKSFRHSGEHRPTHVSLAPTSAVGGPSRPIARGQRIGMNSGLCLVVAAMSEAAEAVRCGGFFATRCGRYELDDAARPRADDPERARNPEPADLQRVLWFESGQTGRRKGDPMQRDLVERAMAGDRDAFTELGRGQIDRLYAIARLILRDDDRAHDATQEALIGAWRDIKGLRDPDRFEPWIRRTLVNACYREARSQKRRWRAEGSIRPIYAEAADPAQTTADRDELARAFETLEPEQRALVVLHYYLGLPMQETALILGLPVGTVKSRLHRTKVQLRATLEADARLPIVEGGAA
jgi:RNA polymerase sigma-70 factor (ECF subfamily)